MGENESKNEKDIGLEWKGAHQERDATTEASKTRVNSGNGKGGLGTLPERADATEVAAAPRKERKGDVQRLGGGSAEERRGGRRGEEKGRQTCSHAYKPS